MRATFCHWQWVSCCLLNAPPVYKISVSNLRLWGTWPSGNSFTGPFPTTISSDILNLVYLDVSQNSLKESIPADLGSCQILNDLILMTTGLPEKSLASVTQLKRLAVFNVFNNQLSGVIPSSLKGKGKSINASYYKGKYSSLWKASSSKLLIKPKCISGPGFFVGIGTGFLTGMALFVKTWDLWPSHFLGCSNCMD